MMLKVSIIFFLCITSASAFMQTLMAVDLILSIFASVADIAHSLLPLLNHHKTDFSADLRTIGNTLEDIKREFAGIKAKIVPHTVIALRDVQIASHNQWIKRYNDNFQEYFKITHSNETLRSRAEELLDIRDGVPGLLDKLQIELVGLGDLSYVQQMFKLFQDIVPDCTHRSQHAVFYDLFQTYLATETIGFSVIMKSISVQEYLQNKPLTSEIETEKELLKKRLTPTIALFKSILAKSSLTVQMCDLGSSHIIGHTYTYFKSLFQGIIYGSRNLGYKDANKYCPQENKYAIYPRDCENAVSTVDKCYINQRFCPNVYNCKKLSYQPEICLNNNQKEERKYQFVTVKGEGYKPACNGGNLQSYDYEDTDLVTYIRNVEYCGCLCDDYNLDDTERYVSLEEVTSDILNNKVIVGLKLRKENKILSIDIEEAVLQPAARINNRTFEWKSIQVQKVPKNESGFHKLSWFDKKGIVLDFIKVPSADYCITGIKFSPQKVNSESLLALEIRITKMDIELGQLDLDSNEWISYDYTKLTMQTLNIAERNTPINAQQKQIKRYEGRHVVNLTPTGFRTSDAGQTTVPYLDLQKIHTELPIVGAGLIFVDSDDSGGFIKLRVYTFNATSLLY